MTSGYSEAACSLVKVTSNTVAKAGTKVRTDVIRFDRVHQGWKVSRLRRKIGAYCEPEMESYRKDPAKADSLVLRAAVDY